MAVTQKLYELEQLDTEIEREEKVFAENAAKVDDHTLLDQAGRQLDALKQQFADIKKQHRLAEGAVDDLLAKIAADEEKLYGGKVTSPKELSNLQHEIALEKSRGDELENTALGIIDRVEEAEKMVTRGTASYEKMENEWLADQQRLKAENEQLTAGLEKLRQQRIEITEDIDKETLDLYESIRKTKKPAVSKVERGICQACHISPSASAMQRARAGQPIQCSCGRLLYVT